MRNLACALFLVPVEQFLVIVIVLFANVLLNIPLRMKRQRAGDSPRSHEHVRIFDRGFVGDFIVGGATITLDYVISRSVPILAHCALIVKASYVHRSEERRVGKECRTRGSPY